MRALAEAGRTPVSRGQVYTVIEHLISTQPGRGPTDSVSKSGPVMIETTRRASRRTTSIWRGSRFQRAAHSTASGRGSTVASSTRAPSAFEITFEVTTTKGTNLLAIQVAADKVHFLVNGTEVSAQAASAVTGIEFKQLRSGG